MTALPTHLGTRFGSVGRDGLGVRLAPCAGMGAKGESDTKERENFGWCHHLVVQYLVPVHPPAKQEPERLFSVSKTCVRGTKKTIPTLSSSVQSTREERSESTSRTPSVPTHMSRATDQSCMAIPTQEANPGSFQGSASGRDVSCGTSF